MPTSRPHRPLWTVAGVVEAPVDHVWSALAARLRQQTAAAGPDAGTIIEDPAQRLFAVQGGWWYRGEHRVDPHPAGALVTYTIHNVARRARWAVPVVLWQYRRAGTLTDARVSTDFQRTLTSLAHQLGCRAYLLPPQ